MGIPVVENDQGASIAQIRESGNMATRMRAGEFSGAGLPPGMHAKFLGVEGTLPDTLARINYEDEQMARRFLAMYMQLGTTQTGSRALGQTFVDSFALAQESIATDYMKTSNEHIIEDLIDINYGIDESAPLLDFVVEDNKKLAIEDLVKLIDAGVITTDPELEEYVRTEYELPEKPEGAGNGSPDVPVGDPSARARVRLKDRTKERHDRRRPDPSPQPDGRRGPGQHRLGGDGAGVAGRQERTRGPVACRCEGRPGRSTHPGHRRSGLPGCSGSRRGPGPG
jgi:hypothetical protein